MINVFYDGECPFCRNFVKLLRLKETTQTVALHNLRDVPKAVEWFARQGFDVDEGMIVTVDQQVFYGKDAVRILSEMSTESPLFNRCVRFLLGGERRARYFYPLMVAGRNLTLRILAIAKIRERSEATEARQNNRHIEAQAFFATLAIYCITGAILHVVWLPKNYLDYFFTGPLVAMLVFLFPRTAIDKKFRVILHALSMMLSLFVVWRSIPYILFDSDQYDALSMALLVGIPVISAIATLASFYSIRFTLIPVALVASNYAGLEREYGLGIATYPDYIPAVELFICMYVTQPLLAILAKPTFCLPFGRKGSIRNKIQIASERYEQFTTVVFIFLVMAHLGNYFVSGVGKLNIGNPFFWLLHNPFYYNSLSGIMHGTVPVALMFPTLFYYTTKLYIVSPLVGNGFVMAQQLLAPWALMSRRLLLWALVIFDIFHILVFLFTGIFFWKWIVINSALLFVVSKYIKSFPISRFSLLLVPMLMVAAMASFHLQKLAWADTNYSMVLKTEALLDDGTVVRVPSNHFLTYSFNFSGPWHLHRDESFYSYYPPFVWGGVFDMDKFNHAKDTCGQFPSESLLPLTGERPEVTFNTKFDALVRRQHKVVSQYQDMPYLVDFFPHHVWSIPGYFHDYYRVNLDHIRGYRFTVTESCLYPDPQGGRLPIMVTGARFIKEVDVK